MKYQPVYCRFFSRIIDFAIELLILFLIYNFIPGDLLQSMYAENSFIIFFIIISVAILYQFFCLHFFQKTIGMTICRIKYLNKELKPLSTGEKLASIFRTRFSPVKYYKDKSKEKLPTI